MKQEVPIKMEDVLVETIRNINPQLYENLTGDQLIKVFHFTFDPIVAKQYILAAMQEWEKITNQERDEEIERLKELLKRVVTREYSQCSQQPSHKVKVWEDFKTENNI